jgi:hypothetical protein
VRLVALAAVLGACSSSPSRPECNQIVDRMVDIFTAGRLVEADGKLPKEYAPAIEKWRQLLKDDRDPTHESMLQICAGQMSSGAAPCVLQARSETELARCFAN